MHNPADLVERYVAIWHEPDAERRRAAVEVIWTPDGAHYSPTLEAHGYDELAARVQRSYQRWVADEGFVFRSAGDAAGHHDTLTFAWEMLPHDGGQIESVGRDFFLLAPDGRARAIYQFILR